jgi:UDP-N-acetylglucosamine 3-dehydrogenase
MEYRRRFGLIGDGIIAKRHKNAINKIGGEVCWIYDPIYKGAKQKRGLYYNHIPSVAWSSVNWVVICSPTYLHRHHVQVALNHNKEIICEKPLCLPWEPLIDDNRINIVLQLRWIKDLPKKANLVKAIMVRDEAFFKTWKGDPKKAGGNIYEFYIHYIDLAIRLGATFEGAVLPEGKQVREIRNSRKTLDIMKVDMQDCYNRMYADIMDGKGVKPRDIFYLTWVLNKYSEKYGYRKAGIETNIVIDKCLM